MYSVYCSLSVTNNQCYRDESVSSRTVVHEELGPILERSTLSKHIFALAFDLTMMLNMQAHNKDWKLRVSQRGHTINVEKWQYVYN